MLTGRGSFYSHVAFQSAVNWFFSTMQQQSMSTWNTFQQLPQQNLMWRCDKFDRRVRRSDICMQQTKSKINLTLAFIFWMFCMRW